MEKIPTPVIVGGGAIVALLVLRMVSGGGDSIKTLGSAPNNNSTDLATIDAKSQGFGTLVNDFTSLALRQADIEGNITMEAIRGENLRTIAADADNAATQRARIQSDTVRQASSDNLAAQRSAQKAETGRSVISGLVELGTSIAHLFF